MEGADLVNIKLGWQNISVTIWIKILTDLTGDEGKKQLVYMWTCYYNHIKSATSSVVLGPTGHRISNIFYFL